MYGIPIQFGRKLDAADQIHLGARGVWFGLIVAREGVVVCDRQRVDSYAQGLVYQLSGGERAVGLVGMRMQIDHRRHSSRASPHASKLSSLPAAATSCNPIGRPARDLPQGIAKAGQPRTLNGRTSLVLARRTSSATPSISIFVSPILGAVVGVAGVSNKST